MASIATAAGGSGSASTSTAGSNPFWMVSNFYAEKMANIITAQLSASQQQFQNQPVNPGQFLRGVRLLARSTGGIGGTVTADAPLSLFANAELDNVDGSQILYPMAGYSHQLAQTYFRPWLGAISQQYDFANSINPSFTLFLQPEVRQQLGCLENTDTRQQYSWTHTINTIANLGITGTGPTCSVTPYVDVWAQPDVADLEGVTNERIPPGVNLQLKTRHYTFNLANAGADNNFLSPLTGNAMRGGLLIVRDSNNARQDYLSDPITWTLDDRTLSIMSPDIVFQWQSEFYASFGQARSPRPTGVYPFPRFFNSGAMLGQGWLYTSNATSVAWESSTASGASNVPGTVELLQEEVYAVGAVDPSLLDM